MSEGFLGRWSKRKLDVKEGKPVEAEPLPEPLSELAPPTPPVVAVQDPLPEAVEAPPPLTLEDVKALTSESDFTRFAAPDVAPDVKNAAMKKLFADPRYNVMDGMDVYIDDYSKPDPIPYAMLRKLASAKFLGLFDQEEKEEAEAAEAARRARDVADNTTEETVAQSETVPPAVPEAPPHADTDLRLQQDDAPPGEDPGRGIG
ncbi:DUF3306 domain-containing protein [Caenimonas soli]|uniref:DUF3306 domain-containing protein n=1 Tax=Caenimonas soli TaxID=2735555 RepID=UPI001555FE52|nr:DUF3306 domain-containing protein [Caenimonas soli]NPC57077.1 DUF3306 domain-containing protein [Caenimonas soli]